MSPLVFGSIYVFGASTLLWIIRDLEFRHIALAARVAGLERLKK